MINDTYQAIDSAFVISELATLAVVREVPYSDARLVAIFTGGQVPAVRRVREAGDRLTRVV